MTDQIVATKQAPRQPDLARGDTLPAPKQRKCIGCGRPWISGHSCLTPSRTPTTPTHWHRHDQGTRLYETHPSPAGQMVYRKTWRCGHVTVECCQGRPAMLEDRAQGREALCYPCAFRANRTATDEEQVRAAGAAGGGAMSTDSHSAMAAEIVRLRAALREIETKARFIARMPRLVLEAKMLAAWIVDRAATALEGGEGDSNA